MYDLLWFLLPVAAASGWFAARKQYVGSAQSRRDARLDNQYYEGLNYLVNEQPDKALNVFVKMLEVNSETVELHLALGGLFRRRGEVDRAIMLHQNLIARPTLSLKHKEQALLELGQDYLKAGVLDRAERLFLDLKQSKNYSDQALKYLIEVYQQEREWEKAVDVAQLYEKVSSHRQNELIAQYYCELGEALLIKGNRSGASKYFKRALTVDSKCVRATLLQGRVLILEENFRDAINTLLRVPAQNTKFTPLIIDPVLDAYEQLGSGAGGGLGKVIREMFQQHHLDLSAVGFSKKIARTDESLPSLFLLENHVKQTPTLKSLKRYMESLLGKATTECKPELGVVIESLRKLVDSNPDFQCEHCGYAAKTLYWQCPSCKTWSSVKPI